jgi:hypothetical protein
VIWLRGVLDRIVLVAAILAAGCVPSFIAQYRQRVGGMLDQAVRDLSPFQEIARRNHGGDINALIRHHLMSTDPTFQQEGHAIQAMVDSIARLREAVTALDAGLFNQAGWLSTHGDVGVARATWDSFVPAMSWTGESLLFAFAAGVAIWLVFLAVWFLFAKLAAAAVVPRRPIPHPLPKKGHKA